MESSPSVKLHQLQALVAVVDHGSIRAAARALHLSQAALTKSLRQLEEDAELALLVRRPTGVVLTPDGLRLLARARLITHQLALARDELQQAKNLAGGRVCVALTPYLTLSVLADAFVWFRKRYPAVELHVTEGLITRVLPGLRDGSLDFALVADSGEVPRNEFSCEHLLHQPQVLAVRAGHPVLANPTAAALAACEWMLPGPSSSSRVSDYLLGMFERALVAPPALVTRGDAMAAIALVRSADIVSVMPLPLLQQPETRGIVAVPQSALVPPGIDLVRIALADAPLTPAAAYLARCLEDACLAQT
jgi:LysR family transcriptional regulator, regulator of abg operon